MSFLDQVSVMILTYNEAPNIGRTLDQLTWARRIVIIDSGSTDETIEIICRYPKAEVVHRPFDDFATQCNFGLLQISSEWVLSLDADYELSKELIAELDGLAPEEQTSGFSASFIYRVFGRTLRANLYPPRTVLYRRERAKYRNEGHGHRVTIDGWVEPLRGKIYHDDRKSLSRWLKSLIAIEIVDRRMRRFRGAENTSRRAF
jgi:glycosyltransferase involved in cell wall biosynthesis